MGTSFVGFLCVALSSPFVIYFLIFFNKRGVEKKKLQKEINGMIHMCLYLWLICQSVSSGCHKQRFILSYLIVSVYFLGMYSYRIHQLTLPLYLIWAHRNYLTKILIKNGSYFCLWSAKVIFISVFFLLSQAHKSKLIIIVFLILTNPMV